MLRLTSSGNGLRIALSLALLSSFATGCQLLVGLGGEEAKGGSGGGTTTSTGGAGGTGGATTTTGGAGGLTGTCVPDETLACYSGPDNTEGKGVCKGGTATCQANGTWGACEGEVVPGPELCAVSKDENCDGLDCIQWVKTFKDVEGRAVAVGANGNVYAAITFNTGIDFGDGVPVVPVGNNDIAILEYDKSGNLVDKRVFGVSGTQFVYDLGIAKDGSLVMGGSSNAAVDFGFGSLAAGLFVVKMDSSLAPVWARGATGSAASIKQLALASTGDVYVAGYGSTIDWGAGSLAPADTINFWVAKLAAADGAVGWAKMTMATGQQIVDGIAVDPSNSLVVTGTNSGKYLGLSSDGTAPNDVYNCCSTAAPFLLRLDPSGNLSDGKSLTGQNATGTVSIGGVVTDALGYSTIVGSFKGVADFKGGTYDSGTNQSLFIVHDQTTGFDQTAHALVQTDVYVYPDSPVRDSDGNIVFYGNYGGPFDLGAGVLSPSDNLFIAKLDKDDKPLWSRTYSLGDGNFRDIAVGPDEDETVLIGAYFGQADLGLGPFSGNGMFILKLGK